MRVRALDSNGDWTFGRGKANYLTGKDAVKQTVTTRIRSCKYDNPLNIESNIDWFGLLSTRGTQNQILNEVERVVLSTSGVTQITQLEATLSSSRVQSLQLTYDTIYDDESIEDTVTGI